MGTIAGKQTATADASLAYHVHLSTGLVTLVLTGANLGADTNAHTEVPQKAASTAFEVSERVEQLLRVDADSNACSNDQTVPHRTLPQMGTY